MDAGASLCGWINYFGHGWDAFHGGYGSILGLALFRKGDHRLPLLREAVEKEGGV